MKQLDQLNKELEVLGEKIENLYAEKRKVQADEKTGIQEQIIKQEDKEKDLISQRNDLKQRLIPGGMLCQ